MKDNGIYEEAQDERMIASFFEQYGKEEIADEGFSERVISRLPKREWSIAMRLNTIWTCICGIAAIVLFVCADGIGIISTVAQGVWNSMLTSVSTVEITLSSVATVLVALLTLYAVAVFDIATSDGHY